VSSAKELEAKSKFAMEHLVDVLKRRVFIDEEIMKEIHQDYIHQTRSLPICALIDVMLRLAYAILRIRMAEHYRP
jgi:hypothetical protein